MPETRREGNGLSLTVTGARENNLQGIDVEFPLGRLVCITGVSGSGKSSLVYEILYKKLNQRINNGRDLPGKHDDLLGVEGRGQGGQDRPVTHRTHAAQQPGHLHRRLHAHPRACSPTCRRLGCAATSRAGSPSTSRAGAARACQGEGYNQIEMQFLPRRNRALRDLPRPALQPRGAGSDHAGQAHRRRAEHDGGHRSRVLHQLPAHQPQAEDAARRGPGLHPPGPAGHHTVWAARPQRVKLATELSKRATGKTVYLLDEPTTGLSFEDCAALLGVLHRLVDAGNTVILIEHNIEVIEKRGLADRPGPRRRRQGRRADRHRHPRGAGRASRQRHRPVPEGRAGTVPRLRLGASGNRGVGGGRLTPNPPNEGVRLAS